MVSIKEAIAAVEALFDGLNETNMREVGLEALRKLPSYKAAQPVSFMAYPDTWFAEVLKLLSPSAPVSSQNPTQLDINSMKAVPFVPHGGELHGYHEPVYRFWSWMELAGFAIPVRHEDRAEGYNKQFPLHWLLTTLGIARLATDHPLAPGAMKRLWNTYGTANPQDAINDSLARLEDAHTCFDRGLWRPAVVLLGLAFEELLMILEQHLSLPAKPNAKARLDELRKAIESHRNGDPKTAALNALNVANAIREARNDAAHKASSTWTATEVDELLADGMRAFPRLAGYVPTP